MKVVKSHLLRVLMRFANVYGTENPFLHAVRGVALNGAKQEEKSEQQVVSLSVNVHCR